MLTVYADESGNDGDSPILTVAGYVSDVETWTDFSEGMERVLNRRRHPAFPARASKRIRLQRYACIVRCEIRNRDMCIVETADRDVPGIHRGPLVTEPTTLCLFV